MSTFFSIKSKRKSNVFWDKKPKKVRIYALKTGTGKILFSKNKIKIIKMMLLGK